MKLHFFGAAETVTGSKYLVESNGFRYLVDCGLFQGYKELRLRNREPFPVDPKTIQAVILTHAHIDHTGYLPLLVKQGFRGTIYATPATKDLCAILLPDAGRIQEEDARHANMNGYSKHHPALPLYTEEDAQRALGHIKAVSFDEEHPLNPQLSFHFSPSGHILGSAFVTLKDENQILVFSGDLGRLHDPVLSPPVQIQHADYLVLESTYGDRQHPDYDLFDYLGKIINGTISKGGSVIIPAFAVGRSQTVLYYIDQLKRREVIPMHLPVYLDSPMALNATNLWHKYAAEHCLSKDACERMSSTAQYVRTPEESKRLNQLTTPAIIISASGMAEGGRILFHLAHYGPDPKNTIIFVGFQAGGTRGDRMLKGEHEIKIHGEMVPIRARVENLDMLSSHADYTEILEWLKGFTSPPKEVFLTHGESGAAESLKKKIEETFGWKVIVPHYLETFEI